MKKSIKIFTSVLSSAILAVSSMPVLSFAEDHITGDINCDGIVNSDDSFMVLDYYAKKMDGKLDEISADDIEKILKYGDLNGDGEVNSADAVEMFEIAIKTLDVNGDGNVDIYDALYIYNFASNISSHSSEEIEALTKLTANVRYNDKTEGMKSDLLKYAFDIAESLADVSDIKAGDADGDGMVDASDASLILSFYADMSSGVAVDKNDNYKYILLGGDYNASSLIDSTDASSILAYYAEASSGSKKA